MCGIIGYVGKNNALEIILNGLERLEYRGYDSAGIAYFNKNKLEIVKEKGNIINLRNKLDFSIKSNLGIGHTRWATHGEANYINSHPHKVGSITIVHNGIIENYSELKEELIKNGYKFISSTDTEIACALLDKLYKETNSIEQAISIFKNKVKGAYAIGLIADNDLDHIYAIKKDSPLIIAIGNNENYIASDVPAILKYTNKYITLEDGEFAKIGNNKILVYDNSNNLIKKPIITYNGSFNDIEKNGFEHFMLKEINEEPNAIKKTIDSYTKNGFKSLNEQLPNFKKFNHIDIVACGSAYHAGLIGKVLIEEYGNIPVTVEVASEYRYKKLFLDNKSLIIIISQSGETADSLAALKVAKEHGAHTLGIINVKESSIARASDYVVYTEAGNEIAVATTKAFSAQIAILSLIALKVANDFNNLSLKQIDNIIKTIKRIHIDIETVINENDLYKKIANKIQKNNDTFFIGRGIDYALALEGSLKLKEISYVNSQGYPSGELKHGTISLIEKGTPVFAVVTDQRLADKTISNIKETKARGAYVILIVSDNIKVDQEIYDDIILIPTTDKIIQSLLTIIPLQLIAYHVAKLRGCDIDKPKNLAKSVTVE